MASRRTRLVSLVTVQVPNVRLGVARVVSDLPDLQQSSSLHLVQAAADHLLLDQDRDVKAAITGRWSREES